MNLAADIFAQSISPLPGRRICRKTPCCSGFTPWSPARARSALSRSRLVLPRGRSRPRVRDMVKVWKQHAGSSKSVRPLPSSSMQLPQISRGLGSGEVLGVVLDVVVLAALVVVVVGDVVVVVLG